jgi:hypothetical protein
VSRSLARRADWHSDSERTARLLACQMAAEAEELVREVARYSTVFRHISPLATSTPNLSARRRSRQTRRKSLLELAERGRRRSSIICLDDPEQAPKPERKWASSEVLNETQASWRRGG